MKTKPKLLIAAILLGLASAGLTQVPTTAPGAGQLKKGCIIRVREHSPLFFPRKGPSYRRA